jgi:hypothetical protein
LHPLRLDRIRRSKNLTLYCLRANRGIYFRRKLISKP